MDEVGLTRDLFFKSCGGIFTVKGSSMKPTLNNGDRVRVRPVHSKDLTIGDIVVYNDNNKNVLVCHRLVYKIKKKNKISFLEKGDNSPRLGLFSEDDIIGKAVCVVKGSNIIVLEKKYYNKKLLLGILCVLFIYNRLCAEWIKRVLFSNNNTSRGISWGLGRITAKCYSLFLKRLFNKISNV